MRKVAAALAALALTTLSMVALAPARSWAAPYVPQASNRAVLNFNTHWLFAGEVPGGSGQAVGLNESGFVPVTLPYFRTHPHKAFPKGDFELPVSWYRRHFSLPATYSGRRINVEFQGVAKVAEVYVNGTLVGTHRGAYTSFTFDITSLVTFGGADNVIAVKVDSMTRNDIPPEGGSVDYFVWGGIVRDVNMIVTDPVNVDWTFVSSQGVNVVNARTRVRNASTVSKSVTVITNVVDNTNEVVATGTATQTIGANSAAEISYNTSAIASPRLWTPDTPSLYTIYTQVRDGSTYVDEHRTRMGIRTVQFNRTDGRFYLNGSPLKLRGLNRHEQYPYVGRAAPNRLQAKDADILKFELGVNIVRTSHYPQDPEFLDRADEIGLMVLEEIPGWNHIGNQAWQDLAVENVREMVTRDRNHPSIVLWGVRINESGDNNAFYTRTNTLARQLDPSRPTGGIRNFVGSQFLEDVYTFNDFSGGAIDPNVLPWLVTEAVGHTNPDRGWDPERVMLSTMNTHLNVENQAHQKANIAGALTWAAFDYNTTFDSESCIDFTCYHGVSDIFRVPSKFAASVFASQRSSPPYISINSYFTANGNVIVAANCQQVELFANNVSRGRINPNLYTSMPRPMFQFTNVTGAPGTLRADCVNGGAVVASDTKRSPGAAVRLVLRADDSTLRADGADMTRIVVEAQDANGQRVPTSNAKVTFSLSGPGAVVGDNPLILEAGVGAVYAKTALGQTGTLTVGASAPGLTGAPAVNVAVQAFTDPIVPTSGAYTFGFPLDFNDRHLSYSGGGWAVTGDSQLFSKDNTHSGTANDTATFSFVGNRAVIYGVQDPAHGSAAISVDGGAELTVSFQASARRGDVALFTTGQLAQGSHTVRVRVVGNGSIALDRAISVSAGPALIAPPPSVPPVAGLVPQAEWTLRSVSSQELEGEPQSLSGPAISAFDGSNQTFWHSRWQEATDPYPHEMQIDLGASYNVAAFLYTPRQGTNANGRIGGYEFYVSTDGTNWGTAVASGTFPNSTATQTISFTPRNARFVRFRALNAIAGGSFAAVANLQVRVASGTGVTTLDERAMTFTGTWQTCSGCGSELFSGTNTWSNVTGDTATLTFTGTQLRFYGVRDPRHGIAAVSIDGGAEVMVDFYNATRQGNFLLWTSPALAPGTHTFRVRVTGTRNASATNTFVVPDRLDVVG